MKVGGRVYTGCGTGLEKHRKKRSATEEGRGNKSCFGRGASSMF